MKLDPVKYKNIDLSEQYLHHMQNTGKLITLSPDGKHWYISSSKIGENRVGRWG